MKKIVELKLNKMFWIDRYKCLGQCIKTNGDQGIFLLQKPIGSVTVNIDDLAEYEEIYNSNINNK